MYMNYCVCVLRETSAVVVDNLFLLAARLTHLNACPRPHLVPADKPLHHRKHDGTAAK